MSWPGSSLPPNAKRPRRRGKGTRRPRKSGGSSTILKMARAAGVAPKAKRTTEAIGRCLSHAAPEVGFPEGPPGSGVGGAWSLAMYLDALSRGRRGNVRLPPEKTPPGVRVVIGVRCKPCKGAGCNRCEMYGWGIRLVVGVRKRARECAKHEAAPPTPTA